MSKTKIEWSEFSYNPIIGCSKCSPGCLNCYAERMARRQSFMHRLEYSIAINNHTGKWSGKCVLVESALDKPLHWKKPRMIFVCSMGDLFHESVPKEWIIKVFMTIANCPQHTFQILTKRPSRMKEWFDSPEWVEIDDGYRPKNLWLGVTVCTQKEADEKIPILLDIPVAVRFVSIEPCLEEINLGNIRIQRDPKFGDNGWQGRPGGYPYLNCLTGREYSVMVGNPTPYKLDWVIVGPETGPKARPCKIEWIESIVDQCKDANVPCFVKKVPVRKNQKDWGNMELWPEQLRVREYPNE